MKSKMKTKPLPKKPCPSCRSKKTVLAGFRHNRGMAGRCPMTPSFQTSKQLFLCRSCGRKFTPDNGYLRMRYPPETIQEAVTLVKKGYSLSEARTRLKRKGVRVSRWSIAKWARRFGR